MHIPSDDEIKVTKLIMTFTDMCDFYYVTGKLGRKFNQ